MDGRKEKERFNKNPIGEDMSSLNGTNEKIKEKFELKKLLGKAASGLMWTIIAIFLGSAELPFGAIPFGIALLSAASSKLVYIYAGLCLSALLTAGAPLVYLCAYTVTIIVRALGRILIDSPADNADEDAPRTLGELAPLLFSEHIWLRMSCSALGAFIIGIYTLVEGGFLYYDLFGTVISMVAAPVAVSLYCALPTGAFSCSDKRYGEASEMRNFAAVCALLFSVVLALKNTSIFGVSLALFVAMASTLYFCRRGGIMYGLVAGTVVGLAYSPMLAPMFAFAAIASGALFGISTFFACLSACTVGVAWALYSEGISALTSILPGALSACLIFAVIEKLFLAELFEKEENQAAEQAAKTEEAMPETVAENQVDEEVQEEKCSLLGMEILGETVATGTEERMHALCETLSSLSSLFRGLSEKTRTPTASDLRQMCDNAFDVACHSCKSRSRCWESEYTSSLSLVSRMCAVLSKKGHIMTTDLPPRLFERCPSMTDIINQINKNCAAHTKQLIEGDKTEIFALDYAAISELISSSLESQKSEFAYMDELSLAAMELIRNRNFPAKGVLVCGNERRKHALISFCAEEELYSCHKQLATAFEDLFCEKLDFHVENKNMLLLSSARRFSVEYAKKSIKAKGEESFCGDTVSIFENKRDNFYSFISDGMGSGRGAALTSGICSVFLSKLLSATERCDLSIEMLSEFLRNKGGSSMHECSATVDLLEYDFLTGRADFYKGGAAPSYIYRGGKLIKLRSSTLPLGIIKEVDVKKISIDTEDGDIIIMVSDGVTQAKEECPWLLDLLRATAKKESLADISEMIAREARLRGGDDDISVVVMKIRAA